MHKLLLFALAAAALAVLSSTGFADVTWTFYETSCSPGEIGIPCPAPAQFTGGSQISFPYALATLTLQSDTSSGSAVWNGFPGPGTPTLTGDPFTFTLTDGARITPSFVGIPGDFNPSEPVSFDISWQETPGTLSASIFVLTVDDEIAINNSGLAIGPSGDWVGSDNILGGCLNALCRMTGYWQSDLAIPEPMSAALVLTGLLATLVAWEAKRRRAGRC